MRTVGELREFLKDLNPDTEIQIMNANCMGDIEAKVVTRRDCDGPYLVLEIFSIDNE